MPCHSGTAVAHRGALIVLNARINPGSPIFAAAVRHLQEVLAAAGPLQAAPIAITQVAQMLSQAFPMGASLGHSVAVAVFGTLGALVIAHPGRLSMASLLNRGQP